MADGRSASWRLMGLVFFVALLFFSFVRWQPEAWLQARIEEQSSRYGIILRYNQLQTDGLAVRMEQASLKTAALAEPLQFESLTIRPAWASLFRGSPAVELQLNWQGQKGEMLLGRQDGNLEIREIDATFDLSLMKDAWQEKIALPVRMNGSLRLSGAMFLDSETGRPLSGNLLVRCHSVAAMLSGEPNQLGDYDLEAGAATPDTWQWRVAGGSALRLQGEGELVVPADIRQPWPLVGRVRIEAVRVEGTLARLLGGKPLLVGLSGNMANPRVKRL